MQGNDTAGGFALLPHAELLRRAGAGAMQISTPVRLGRTDLGYAEVGLRGWQCTYRLPGDLPGFADAVEALRASSSFGEPVSLLVDPVRFAVLDVAIPGPRPTREISPR